MSQVTKPLMTDETGKKIAEALKKLESITGIQGPQGIQGEKGDTGPQGPKGEKGDKGDKGDTGATGATGAAGAAGADGVSPTVTTEAITGGTKVTITDKDGAHEFDVMNGANGAAGKSAYASAQDGGFTGTEAQFNKGLSVMGSVSGIDTTVKQNSGNLITSGAVYSYIQSLDANGVKY